MMSPADLKAAEEDVLDLDDLIDEEKMFSKATPAQFDAYMVRQEQRQRNLNLDPDD